MYPVEAGRVTTITGRNAALRRTISATVWYLGFTSLLTDISSEMVSTILPVYLVLHLRLSPVQFGLIDGLYQGVTAILRLASAYIADKSHRYKETACAGYALSAVCKLGLLLAGTSWPAIASVIALDRTGKGIRTSPRDALIALNTPSSLLGAAFGVHRTLDAGGAMLGPVLASLILAQIPGGFDVIFVVSFLIALVGLGTLVLFVDNAPPVLDASGAPSAVCFSDALRLFRQPRFRSLSIAGALLGITTVSDSFLYLAVVHNEGLGAQSFPLLYFATALVFLLFSFPAGRLGDKIGKTKVFISGYGALLAAYGVALIPGAGATGIAIFVVFLGMYYAATDGVLMAIVGSILPPELCTTGLGMLTTVISIARLLSSVAAGFLWMYSGSSAALCTFAVALLASMAAGFFQLRRQEPLY
jgi:MFS family permease